MIIEIDFLPFNSTKPPIILHFTSLSNVGTIPLTMSNKQRLYPIGLTRDVATTAINFVKRIRHEQQAERLRRRGNVTLHPICLTL